ncbi:MAG: hypothetical protein GC204_10770 [Chloroflexi bacterium]|nr:hypothetical protein [Chloroflexota bacterium]
MQLADQIPNLEQFGNAAPKGYRYYEKIAVARDDLSLPQAYLKWYDLYPAEDEVTPQQRAACQAFVAAQAEALKLDHELGFVILHRAGQYLLLLLTTWRNTNEMWEAVYVKDLTSDKGYQPLNFTNDIRGTYCVWELGIVWHERHAWVRFLSTERDNAAKLAYINDRFAGRV